MSKDKEANESEAEGYQFSKNKVIKEETVNKRVNRDKRIESKDNIQTFSSMKSEEDELKLCIVRF